MNIVRIFIAYIDYLLIRVLNFLYKLIPDQKSYSLGFIVGTTLYPFFSKRRRIAIDNILQAKITTDPQRADAIARHSFGHLVGHLCEAFKISNILTAHNWRDHIILEGPEASWRLLLASPETPIIILTGHHGVWETAATIVSFTRPIIAIARRMNNPFVNRFLKASCFRGEITIIPKDKGFTPNILRAWKQKGAAMTLVMDQHAGPKYGMMIDFMGRPASTHTSPARLHLQFGAPILIGSVIREAPFKYRMITEEPITFTPTGNQEADTAALLTQLNQRLETLIRRYPEQYLWAHKRWK